MAGRCRLFARSCELDDERKQQFLESIVITLLDESSNYPELHVELQHQLNCRVCQAIDTDECLHLLSKYGIDHSLVFLIITDSLIDSVHSISIKLTPQLTHIYVLHSISHAKQSLADHLFRGFFTDAQLLVETLRGDIADATRPRRRYFDYFDAYQHQCMTVQSATFIWYRFFFNVLDCLRLTDTAMREFIARARDIHRGNMTACREIDELERTYRSDQTILWYTRESFFYRLLNQSLRSNDINQIFESRHPIHDLTLQLRTLRSNQVAYKCGTAYCRQEPNEFIRVYRGQLLHIDEVNNHEANIGSLVAMNSFWSTSFDRRIAKSFAGNIGSENASLQSVMYNISIPFYSTNATFGDIRGMSYGSDELEVLFLFRSIFRIDQVKLVDRVWDIDLTLVDEDHELFRTVINPWKAVIGERSFFSGRQEQLFVRDLNLDNGAFLSFQLLVDIMLRLERTEFARHEMLEMCRKKYAENPIDLKKIDEFERTYRPEDAIRWYTAGCFLYRLLNESLRIEDIDTIFKLRYFIYDLHNQLAQLQISYIQSLPQDQPLLTLYRGQRMTILELERFRANEGSLVSMNSFLSTTSYCTAAVFFSGHGTLDDPEKEVSVLYQITIDTSVPHSVPFSKTDYRSIFTHEDEVLFSMAAVFQIGQTEQNGNLWVVDLTLTNKEDERWNILTAHLN